MTPVIHTERLGKRYQRGAVEQRGTLRDSIMKFARSPLAAFRTTKQETFWALDNVSLDVRDGEVFGLIGRNGAGKTTLLRILSRITKPTSGYAEIRGHVRSLLEVGTGFHGELTGRENTYFSGSLLGMKKQEIDRKLDEIIAFAEIEKFIDTPVKHYSSGMYVRLAFAVAAHLEPEILLVDEVLAVGDINFQKKCLGKMGDVAREGRTVVLVSHQMSQMRRLCGRIAWIDGGHVRMTGGAHDVISAYESAMARSDDRNVGSELERGTKGRFISWEIVEPASAEPHMLTSLEPTTVKFRVRVDQHLRHAIHGIALFNHDRVLIWGWATEEMEISAGNHEFCFQFPMLPLRPGPYTWLVSLYEDLDEVDVWDCVPEMVVASETYQHQYDRWNGVLNVPNRFSVVRRSGSN